MKKIIIITIAVVACLVTLSVLLWLNRTPMQNNTSVKTVDNAMHTGAVVRAFGLDKPYSPYNQQNLIKQLDYLKELGASDSRANAEIDMTVNDDFVRLSLERSLTPTLILEPPELIVDGTYNSMYSYAQNIATRFKGKVPYYQLANEASGVTIKQGFPGNKISDYDETKYTHFKNIVKGLSDGVRAGDSDAQRIISSNWLGVGVMDKLIADKVDFEIIGWNWYSLMGDDLTKTLDDGSILDIPAYLAHYNKRFWVVEINRDGGSFDGNMVAQATYLDTFAKNIAKRKNITGFFVFTLTDQCDILDQPVGRLGLISLSANADKSCTITTKKPAFDAVKVIFDQILSATTTAN